MRGNYEPDDVGLQVAMSKAAGRALGTAVDQIRNTGSYVDLFRVILSRGRDNDDPVWPESTCDLQ